MDMTDDEREYWRGMRALTMNEAGYEVFVGLDAAESERFLGLSRRHEAGEDLNDDQAYRALRERHEAARQEVVNGRADLDG